jgi:hypothetical protein
MMNGLMNTPDEINYWIERCSVFKQDNKRSQGRTHKSMSKQIDKLELDMKREAYFEEVTNTVVDLGVKSITTPKSSSPFYDLSNSVLFEALVSKKDLVLIDMPELMLRMKVASMFSLEQLRDIFNDILNKVSTAREHEPQMTDVAAYYYYADVF